MLIGDSMRIIVALVALLLTTAAALPAAAASGPEDAPGPAVATDTATTDASPDRPVHGADADTGTAAEPAGGDFTAMATCLGCTAFNTMYWTNYGGWESVGVKRTQNTADEIIDKQETHVALMNSPNNECYDGDFKFQDGTGDLFNQQNSPKLSSGKYTAFNDRWTQASGHNWFDDGGHFFVNAANDRCRQF